MKYGQLVGLFYWGMYGYQDLDDAATAEPILSPLLTLLVRQLA